MKLPSAQALATVSFLVWLLKDFGWVLLCAPLAWPAASAAICLETLLLLQEWSTASLSVRVHDLATILWLSGNTIWMSAEFLVDPDINPGRAFPWHTGPLTTADESALSFGERIACRFFSMGLILLLAFYFVSIYLHSRSSTRHVEASAGSATQSSQQRPPASVHVLGFDIAQEVYTRIFIGPWILKDILWTYESLWPALVCSLMVMVLMADYLRRYGDAIHLAELLWVSGNAVWIFGELQLLDAATWPRVAAGAIFLCGGAVTVLGAMGGQTPPKPSGEKCVSSEGSRLLTKSVV